MYSSTLIHLGDLHLTAGLAGAVAAWLLAARSYRSACQWCIAYGSAVGLIAASKVIYLGWGLQVPALAFKAASGHAAGATAVLPIVFYLLGMSIRKGKENLALAAGWTISSAVAIALVRHGEHAPSEAFAGWCVGMTASAFTWTRLRCTEIRPSLKGFGSALALMVMVAICIHAVPVGRWMTTTALALSGERQVHTWNDC